MRDSRVARRCIPEEDRGPGAAGNAPSTKEGRGSALAAAGRPGAAADALVTALAAPSRSAPSLAALTPLASWDDDGSGQSLAFWARFENRWLVEVRRDGDARVVVFDHAAGDGLAMDCPLSACGASLPLTGEGLAKVQLVVEEALGRPAPGRHVSIRSGQPGQSRARKRRGAGG